MFASEVSNSEKGIEVKITFDIGNGPVNDKGLFAKAEHADWFLLQYRKQYLLIAFELFVMQCKNFLQGETLASIAKTIYTLRKDLLSLLPSHHHQNFASLTRQYKDIENLITLIIQ